MNLRKVILGSLVSAPLALVSGQAFSASIIGQSSGQFSNITSCDSGTNCAIHTGSTVVEWGYTQTTSGPWYNRVTTNNYGTGSTLTANPVVINDVTNAANLVIGQLTWVNRATEGDDTPDNFNVAYLLSVAFSAPGAASDQEPFGLSITNSDNPAGDTLTGFNLSDLSNLVFTFANVTVSNLHYFVLDQGGDSHAGGVNGCDGSNGDTKLLGGESSSKTWFNCEGNTSVLQIRADFTDNAVVGAPEPMTLGLFSLGLLGVGAAARRRIAKA